MRGLKAALYVGAGLAMVGLSACGGGDGSPTASTPPATTPPADNRTIEESPSFSATVQEIFVRRSCNTASCHGTARAAGLDLSAGGAYASLVSVASANEPAFLRVSPGDPENSYLVIKVEGRQTVGSLMPIGGTPLDDIDLANIRNWIAQGAQNN